MVYIEAKMVGLPVAVMLQVMRPSCVRRCFSFFLTKRTLVNRGLALYSTMSNTEVNHDIQAKYFFIKLGEGE
jgi:hypothetical protein